MTIKLIQEQTPTIEKKKKKKIRQKVSRVRGGLFTPLVQTSKPTLQKFILLNEKPKPKNFLV